MNFKERLIEAAEYSHSFKIWWGHTNVLDYNDFLTVTGWLWDESEAWPMDEDETNSWFLLFVAEAADA